MGFKLIRIDTEEPCKVPLKVGTHIIGRGDSLLNCEDQRVSRNHAVIQVTDDSVILKSLHQNPCFYNKLSKQKTLVLSTGEHVSLSNTDHFGLLPDSHWYELVSCHDSQTLNPNLTNSQVKLDDSGDGQLISTEPVNVPTRATSYYTNKHYTYKPECDDNDEINTLKLVFDETMEGESQSLIAQDNLEQQNTTNNQSKDENTNNNALTPSKRQHSPDPSFDAKKVKKEPESPNKEFQRTKVADTQLSSIVQNSVDDNTDTQNTTDEETEPKDPDEVNKELQENNPKQANLAPSCPIDTEERKASSDVNTDSESAYEAETDPSSPEKDRNEEVAVKKEPLTPDDKKEIKKDPDAAKAGSSHDTPGSSNDGAPTAKQPPRPRERCNYGANCYRKNPQHKADFSHPQDWDYGAGPTAPCPYGAACRRADPRHWAQHDHPPGTMPPHPHRPQQGNPRKRQRKVRAPSESDSSDQDTASPDLIVQGKRKRKTVKRDSWSDSEEETKDPFATDESDEWTND